MKNIKITLWIIPMMIIILFVSVMPVFGFSCCAVPGQSNRNSMVQGAFSESPSPDFTVSTINGGVYNLQSQRGRPVILLFIDSLSRNNSCL